MATKLYFRYSDIYDESLANLAEDSFDYKNTGWKYEKTNEFSKYWEPFNDKVFDYYNSIGLTFPEFWVAYFVESRKDLIPFSDPLTLLLKDNNEVMMVDLVHELCHSLFVYYENEETWNKVFKTIETKYSNEDFITKVHLIVIIFTYFGLLQIIDKDKIHNLLDIEKNYDGLKRSWEILDSMPSVFESEDPFQALDKLVI